MYKRKVDFICITWYDIKVEKRYLERKRVKSMKKNTAKQIHKLYEDCKKMVENTDLTDGISSAENEVEKEFYVLLCDFFLQQEQKKAIKNGVF